MSTYNKWISRSGIAGIIALLSTGACNGTDVPPTDDGQNASVGMKLSGPPSNPDFTGNSIRICGERSSPADGKYFCSSDLALNNQYPEPLNCPCFNFDADGQVTDKALDQLCPAEDLDQYGNYGATWDFRYYIYTGLDCGGTLMTGAPGTGENPHNLICYDIDDLKAQNYSNSTVGEELNKGEHIENHVICLTENAHKSFDFDSCAVDGTSPLDLNCGCYFDPNTYQCVCSQGFDPYYDLPAGCAPDDYSQYPTCNIICY